MVRKINQVGEIYILETVKVVHVMNGIHLLYICHFRMNSNHDIIIFIICQNGNYLLCCNLVVLHNIGESADECIFPIIWCIPLNMFFS